MSDFFSSNLIYLREIKGETQEETATALDISRSTYVNYETSPQKPKADICLKIIGHFDISFEDLMLVDLSKGKDGKKKDKQKNRQKGKDLGKDLGKDNASETQIIGSVLVPDSVGLSMQRAPKVITLDTSGRENMVMVPVRARAGYLNGYGDVEYIEKLPAFRLPGFTNGTFRIFEVEGLSMYPTFDDKDLIITRFVEDMRQITNDRIHVVVTKNDGVVVKRVLNRIETEGKLILKSDNIKDRQDYPTMIVDIDEILEVWYGVSFMSRFMRAPGEIYTRLIDLEARFTLMEDTVKKSLR
jgi:DNA-binding XRE family transcriptional regulator